MARHLPSSIWPTRSLGTYPQHYVKTHDADTLKIIGFNGGHSTLSQYASSVMLISRKDARLLAKRINQCLDASRS